MRIAILLVAANILFDACSAGDDPTSYVTIDRETFASLHLDIADDVNIKSQENGFVTLATDEEAITKISQAIHSLTGKCGGFFTSDDAESAQDLQMELLSTSLQNPHNYRIRGHRAVDQLLSKVDANQIQARIQHLSQKFLNRYYNSDTGVKSQAWLAHSWRMLNSRRRPDFSVKEFNHADWQQPSIIASITGHKYPDEIVIIGGHGDSISGFWGTGRRAPGADDNASGIASVSEILRVILSSNYRPSRTLVFMSYAAEEVGLRGSREIARAYREAGKNVLAVMQLDMTNHASSDSVISFIRDHTDDKLSLFTQALANRYLKDVTWVDDRCGYACSDHASWTAAGFAAVFPFETKKADMNRFIHTADDTLDNSDSTAQHATIFARLGLAFAIETAK